LFQKPSTSTFQILSDLHLEVGQQYSAFEVPVSAPYLILAGDIGRLIDYKPYLDFLAKQTNLFKKVFLVLGNHEFYGLSFTAAISEARRLASEPVLQGRLVLLDRTRYDVSECPGVTILGCVLWSNIPESAREVVTSKVKDFQKIIEWTVDDHNKAFETDSAWLKQQFVAINKENEGLSQGQQSRRILVVTHHAPSVQETASPNQVGNAWSSAFATDLLAEDVWRDVHTWVFGHTHYTTEFEKRGVKVVSNQRGYVLPGSSGPKSENGVKDRRKKFDVRRVVQI
jgi:predicted phosphodiesterase